MLVLIKGGEVVQESGKRVVTQNSLRAQREPSCSSSPAAYHNTKSLLSRPKVVMIFAGLVLGAVFLLIVRCWVFIVF